MKTKEIVEALLFNIPNIEEKLRIGRVLNDSDRNWQPVEHKEFHFIDNFINNRFLIIVDKRIHIFIIGDIARSKSYNILSINGNTTELLTLNKQLLLKHIKNSILSTEEEFLPQGLTQKIIFIDNKEPLEDNIFIFEKTNYEDKLYKKSTWFLGNNNYKLGENEYETTTKEILLNCLKELDEE